MSSASCRENTALSGSGSTGAGDSRENAATVFFRDKENRTSRPVSKYIRNDAISGWDSRRKTLSGTPAIHSRSTSAHAIAALPTCRLRR